MTDQSRIRRRRGSDRSRPGAASPAPRPRALAATSAFASSREAAAALGIELPAVRPQLRRFPMRWSRYYLGLVDPADPFDPVARMGRPDPRELEPAIADVPDPVGDRARRPVPYLVRKYPDRVVLLVTSRCHFYCRFCFRRDEGVGPHREPTPADLDRALAYVARHPRIREVILSGGDPLTMSDGELDRIGGRIASIASVEGWRIHTRAPVHFPGRVTPELLRVLSHHAPLRIVTHFNHPREITPVSLEAIGRLAGAGIDLANQAVLLAGVNDDPDVLAELVVELARHGVAPYYLHHPDRAPGNHHFRLTLGRGLEIVARLNRLLPPDLRPRYVIDPPDGGGKIAVDSLKPRGRGLYIHRDAKGRERRIEDFTVTEGDDRSGREGRARGSLPGPP